MALTFAVTNLKKSVIGDRRLHRATLTTSGTTSDNGDSISASALGLAKIESAQVTQSVDSVSNPENSFVSNFIPVDGGATGLITLCSQATAGATTPLGVITDATTVTNYVIQIDAIGY